MRVQRRDGSRSRFTRLEGFSAPRYARSAVSPHRSLDPSGQENGRRVLWQEPRGACRGGGSMIDPMKVGDARFLIERAHREMSPLQWVRETAKNAAEAGATKLVYGTEMQAVESRKVHRRLIADNGKGMSPD